FDHAATIDCGSCFTRCSHRNSCATAIHENSATQYSWPFRFWEEPVFEESERQRDCVSDYRDRYTGLGKVRGGQRSRKGRFDCGSVVRPGWRGHSNGDEWLRVRRPATVIIRDEQRILAHHSDSQGLRSEEPAHSVVRYRAREVCVEAESAGEQSG